MIVKLYIIQELAWIPFISYFSVATVGVVDVVVVDVGT